MSIIYKKWTDVFSMGNDNSSFSARSWSSAWPAHISQDSAYPHCDVFHWKDVPAPLACKLCLSAGMERGGVRRMLSRFLQDKYHAKWDPSENPKAWLFWKRWVVRDGLKWLVLEGYLSCAIPVKQEEHLGFDGRPFFCCEKTHACDQKNVHLGVKNATTYSNI